MDAKSHWEGVYRLKKPTEGSWYKPHLAVSLQPIEEAAPGHHARIIDVGGDESTLVDELVWRGYTGVDVLDLSATALEVAARRLGANATNVRSARVVPTRCSGLDVVRYDADTLHCQFGPRFSLVKHLTEQHRTPSGAVQQFVFCFRALAH